MRYYEIYVNLKGYEKPIAFRGLMYEFMANNIVKEMMKRQPQSIMVKSRAV